MCTSSLARNTTVPNTRRIGCEKLPAVYCVAGLGSGKPQSQAGARRVRAEARRWMASAPSPAASAMKKKSTGRVIFLSSVVGEAGNAGQTAYAASKAGLLGVTKSLAKEYASINITVYAVTPGYIATDMTSALNDAQRAAMLTGVPLGRPGQAEEIGATIAFLASDEAGYITGQAIRVNGGMYM